MKKINLFLCSVFIATSFVYAQEISSNIKGLLSSEGKILFGNEPNSIVVIDYPQSIQRIAEYLEAMDVLPSQVLIEARVVEVKLQKEHSLGVNWQAFAQKGGFEWGQFKIGSLANATDTFGPPSSFKQEISYKPTFYPPGQETQGEESPFTISIFDEDINVVLKALANSLDTNILSAPRVTTVNNREAEIKIIQSLPWAEPEVSVSGESGSITVTWKVNFEEVGIILKATPIINDDGKITMTLNPEVSEKVGDYGLTVVQGTTQIPYTVPIIDKRTANTKVVIGNGQTLIIGGLIKEKVTKGQTKVPFFGDLPMLGYLFKSEKDIKEKTELLIFVSPTVITSDEFVSMAKQERYGIGKDYMEERGRQALMLSAMEIQEKTKKDELASQLDLLSQKQKVLVEERKKLETRVLDEEDNIKSLEKNTEAIIQRRKELEKIAGK